MAAIDKLNKAAFFAGLFAPIAGDIKEALSYSEIKSNFESKNPYMMEPEVSAELAGDMAIDSNPDRVSSFKRQQFKIAATFGFYTFSLITLLTSQFVDNQEASQALSISASLLSSLGAVMASASSYYQEITNCDLSKGHL